MPKRAVKYSDKKNPSSWVYLQAHTWDEEYPPDPIIEDVRCYGRVNVNGEALPTYSKHTMGSIRYAIRGVIKYRNLRAVAVPQLLVQVPQEDGGYFEPAMRRPSIIQRLFDMGDL